MKPYIWKYVTYLVFYMFIFWINDWNTVIINTVIIVILT